MHFIELNIIATAALLVSHFAVVVFNRLTGDGARSTASGN